MSNSKLLKVAIASALVLLMAHAQADVIKSANRNDNFTFNGGPVSVPLNNSGDTSTTFKGNGAFTIGYTGECAVDAADDFTWLDIDILVDGVEITPTNSDYDAFCTSNGTAGSDGWIMAAVNGRTGSLANITHTVQVIARTSDGSSGGHLGDSSLTIWK